MNDLGFIKECSNCKHNISYIDSDIKTEFIFKGYIISCKVWGTEQAYNTEIISEIDILIERINSLGGSECPTKIIKRVYKVYDKISYVECPNCKEKNIIHSEQRYKSWPRNSGYDIGIATFYFNKYY